MISIYSDPHAQLLAQSHGTLISCLYSGDNALSVVDVSSIQSVVGMIPHHPFADLAREDNRYFVVERPGLDFAKLAGITQHVSELN